MTTTLNGWDVEAMTQAITMVKEQPEAGLLTWRGRSIWDGGFGLDVRTREIEQLGEVMDRHFTLRSDHPPELLGKNTGPAVIETVLAALGGCMTGAFAAQATARGVRIDSLTVDLECTIDLNGFSSRSAPDYATSHCPSGSPPTQTRKPCKRSSMPLGRCHRSSTRSPSPLLTRQRCRRSRNAAAR
jgi:hypothetical protein